MHNTGEGSGTDRLNETLCHHKTMFKAALVIPAFLSAAVTGLHAENHALNMRQAVELALKQNPDIVLARLDEQRTREAVRVARDPFTPRVGAGSGLAYSDGFPMA